MSSILRRSSADISPFSSLARASLMRSGRNRLPTSSARKGAFVRCMSHSRKIRAFSSEVDTGSREETRQNKLACRSPRNAEKAFEYRGIGLQGGTRRDRKSTRLNSSHTVISYAVFCLKKKKKKKKQKKKTNNRKARRTQ